MSCVCLLRRSKLNYRRRLGLTLIELLVALAISAMLFATVVGVLRGVNFQLQIALRKSDKASHSGLVDSLYRDLFNASAISSSDGWIWLDGVFPTLRGEGQIAKRVGYRCVPWINEEQTAIVRFVDGRGELVAVGPRRIVIERLDSSSTPQPLSPSSTPLPARLRLWVWDVDAKEANLVTDMVLR